MLIEVLLPSMLLCTLCCVLHRLSRDHRNSAHTALDRTHVSPQGDEDWVDDNVAFQFSLGPAKTAVVLIITEDVSW